ncbi:unnamed protein product [Peronospora belbahrii]|uniref:Roadblock/LAMTOR2 domain-containing protein n=1 Tax=Peronospora belbahrii TaxID=622444 RepID=A0AAU9KYL0_9STRA|nr:unnamed protein product [Peronospora belbahrii]CAH0514366.1 unnamed protein product [Peronospora belbahrii]
MTTRNTRYWRKFLSNLLTSSNVLNEITQRSSAYDGVCVLTLSGRVVYRDGCFHAASLSSDSLDIVDPLQILALFDHVTRQAIQKERHVESVTPALRIGLHVFHIVSTTCSSICAVTCGKTRGLVVEKLPFGVLVVAFSAPLRLETVFRHLDDACAALRL